MKSDEKLVIQTEKNETLGDLFRNADSSMVGRRRNWVAHRNYKGTCGSH